MRGLQGEGGEGVECVAFQLAHGLWCSPRGAASLIAANHTSRREGAPGRHCAVEPAVTVHALPAGQAKPTQGSSLQRLPAQSWPEGQGFEALQAACGRVSGPGPLPPALPPPLLLLPLPPLLPLLVLFLIMHLKQPSAGSRAHA